MALRTWHDIQRWLAYRRLPNWSETRRPWRWLTADELKKAKAGGKKAA